MGRHRGLTVAPRQSPDRPASSFDWRGIAAGWRDWIDEPDVITANPLPNAWRLITLEGGEGVGKSTVLHHVSELLATANAAEVVLTREPGGTRVGEALREILLGKGQHAGCQVADATELLLLFAARAQHMAEVIQPALARGAFVLCDRFTDSTYAYQGAAGSSALEHIRDLESRFVGIHPGLTLLLDAPVDVGRQRLAARGDASDRIEEKADTFFERVRAGFLSRAQADPGRIKVINAARDPAEVRWQVQRTVLEYLAGHRISP